MRWAEIWDRQWRRQARKTAKKPVCAGIGIRTLSDLLHLPWILVFLMFFRFFCKTTPLPATLQHPTLSSAFLVPPCPPPPLATSAGAATFQSLSSFKRLDTKFIGYLLWISNMVKLAGCISARIDPNKKRKTPTHLRRLAFQNRSCIGSIRLQRIQQNNHPPTGPQHPSPSSVALSGWTSTASKHSLGIGPLWSSLTLH